MSDLRVMAFPGEDTADQVLNTLQALQKEHLIDLLVRHATQDKVLPEVRPFGGKVIHTSLSTEQETRVWRALEGVAVAHTP